MAYKISIENDQMTLKAAAVKKVVPMSDVTSVQTSINKSFGFMILFTIGFLFLSMNYESTYLWIGFGVCGLISLLGKKKVLIIETRGGSKYRCFADDGENTIQEVFEKFKSVN